jgi:formiminotetrahydrofolate cyclodeaminase
MLVDKSVRELLAAFSSSEPTPGGGSAAALASSIGASLLMMVAGLPKTRTNADAERNALHGATTVLTGVRQQLTEAIDADTAAYDMVVAAYKQARSTPEEQQARKAAIERGLRTATDVPLAVMRLSAQALAQAAIVAEHGLQGAASDVGVAQALLCAGATGARLNIEINLDGLSDAAYAAAVRGEVASLAEEVDRASDRVRSSARR